MVQNLQADGGNELEPEEATGTRRDGMKWVKRSNQ